MAIQIDPENLVQLKYEKWGNANKLPKTINILVKKFLFNRTEPVLRLKIVC